MKKINILRYVAFTSVLLPTVSFAFFENVKKFLLDTEDILYDIQIIVFTLALLFFFWGMGQFILRSGDSKAREEGKQKMIWGIIALFVMFSIYGILRWIGTEIGVDVDERPFLPPIE